MPTESDIAPTTLSGVYFHTRSISHPYQTTQLKIIHINTKPHNPKNPKNNSFYAFDDSKRHQQKQIHTSKKRWKSIEEAQE